MAYPRAVYGCGNVTIAQRQAVVVRYPNGLVGGIGDVQRAVKPVAATVAGEHMAVRLPPWAAGAGPHDQHPRIRIAKPRQWLGLISLPMIATRRAPLCGRFGANARWGTFLVTSGNFCVERRDFQIHMIARQHKDKNSYNESPR